MGKQPKTGVYQLDAFQESQAVKMLRHEMKHLIHQELIYGNAWTPEKRSEVTARMSEIREIIALLGG